MTIETLDTLLKGIGYPVAYMAFQEPLTPPCIAYHSPYSNNFMADNGVNVKINHWAVELYNDNKDTEAEAALESVLSVFCWQKSEAWIESEKLLQVVYEFEEVNE